MHFQWLENNKAHFGSTVPGKNVAASPKGAVSPKGAASPKVAASLKVKRILEVLFPEKKVKRILEVLFPEKRPRLLRASAPALAQFYLFLFLFFRG